MKDIVREVVIKRKSLIEWALFEAKKYLSRVEKMPKAQYEQRKLIDELNIRHDEITRLLGQLGETK